MASNALTKRRQFMKRPPVCKSSPNPGRCHPPPDLPPRVCWFDPVDITEDEEENWTTDLYACCEPLPHDEVLSVVLTIDGNPLELGDPAINCGIAESVGEHPALEIGTYQIKAVITWSDGGTCTALGTVTWVEDE